MYKYVNNKKVLVSAAEEAEILSGWADSTIIEAEEKRISGIKAEADLRIVALIPDAKPDDSKTKILEREVNLLMLNAELDDIVIKGGTLTTEQAAMKASFIQLKDNIKAIRDMSNIAESAGHTLNKFKSDLDLAGL